MHAKALRSTFIALIALGILSAASDVRAEGMNNLYAAINGIVVAPTDPIHWVIVPPEDYEELPFHQVTGRIVALPAGVLMMGFRLFMAVGDLVAWPFWVFEVFSPEPELFQLIPDVEYE